MEDKRYTVTVTIRNNSIDKEKTMVFQADEISDFVNTCTHSHGRMDFYTQETEVTLQLTSRHDVTNEDPING